MWRKSRFFCNFTARIKSKATMKKLTTLISVCIFLLAMQGCNKEFFDKEKVEEILELSFHNDTIDANHTWRLMSEHNIQVTTTVNNVERIELLTADPHESDKAELLAENSITTGVTITMSYSVHLAQQQLYAAAVDSNGAAWLAGAQRRAARLYPPERPGGSGRPEDTDVLYDGHGRHDVALERFETMGRPDARDGI